MRRRVSSTAAQFVYDQSKYPPAEPGAYMRLRKSRVFFTGFSIGQLPFPKGVVRAVEQCKAYVCIHGMNALFAWPGLRPQVEIGQERELVTSLLLSSSIFNLGSPSRSLRRWSYILYAESKVEPLIEAMRHCRVEDWRAGLGRSSCSLLARPFVCECHSMSG